MDESMDGRIERTFVMDGVEWMARLMPFGEPARHHRLGERIETPPNGIRFTGAGREGFLPTTQSMTPSRFQEISEDDLRRSCAKAMRQQGEAGERIG
jgi:hypothetical protein